MRYLPSLLPLYRRHRGRIRRGLWVSAGVFGVGLLLLWALHPEGPDILRRLAEKPVFLVKVRSAQSCEGCHRELDPGLYRQWWESTHARVNVGCAACHGEDHETIFAEQGRVSAGRCGTCHEQVVADFASSEHATAEADAEANARFLAQPPAMREEGCMGCHSIGARFADGSVGRCNKCHPGHAFSAAVAREPEACEVCHIGPDHPQVEAYRTSVHGILYLAERDPEVAPSCVTCHMPGGAHGSQANLTLGQIASGAMVENRRRASVNIPMRQIGLEEMVANRERMLAVCAPCHTRRFARQSLERADAIKREADRLVAMARAIVLGLEADGLLDPMPVRRPPNPVAGHTVVLGGQQVYENTSEIEQAFFRMFKFYHAKTFKGAYHQSPDYTHWKGNAFLQMELDRIRSEARRLRGLSPAGDPGKRRERVAGIGAGQGR